MPSLSRIASSLTVAYYLPQFHQIPENDEWWGAGFTEWTNVRKARPQYDGHDHPRRVETLGQYDLRSVEVMHRQADLAKRHDVDAFCFYFYWFDGHRLLERPVDNYLQAGPNFPFCLSWANENWTRRWDGKEHEVLMGQNYSGTTAEEIFDDFLPYFRDERYLRVDGALVLVIHRVDHVPDAAELMSSWRRLAKEYGLGELHIIAAETKFGIEPTWYGVDAISEFPPVGSNTLASAQLLPVKGLRSDFSGRIMSYERMAKRFMRRRPPSFTRYRGVVPGWDNTARRGNRATIYVGHNPRSYGEWLTHARRAEDDRQGTGLVFINAWNEWAEGAYLEPDATWGTAFLEATQRNAGPLQASPKPKLGAPSLAWLRSVSFAVMGSAVSLVRRVRPSRP
ncbi:glycoside hydrolase family 99-like domain-containing protein [Arthrobacter sp. ISL-28]|uniref:glycosyltransferase WbsX family protein n=1 Tax=Arthrobacter sp. ISL-28 TaxID=2819108 RepID=UPI001BE8C5A7|nr:glycoside hydrolase family 99-like domain-containing protein [Arthrobacter sp. ISL-28]MBT2519669.1 glycoside hydrolase family 99-like domain-containing protein [Arthrobacter sp. ISL-28]